MDERDLALVASAIERLTAHVLASGCDADYARTIHMAGVDILAILRGEWDAPADDPQPALFPAFHEAEATGEGR